MDNVRAQAMARIQSGMQAPLARRYGRVISSNGEILHVSSMNVPVGARCVIDTGTGTETTGEVIGFAEGSLIVMPEQGMRGIMRGARVQAEAGAIMPLVGEALLGRVIDARGAPLDGLEPPVATIPWPLLGRQVNPMERAPIELVFDTGITAINALATIGRGMRIGLFAGSGVGKTTLMGMMARHAQADIVIAALIGERGREIREFVDTHLGAARPRSVVVAAPADDTALARLHGAYRAASIAEYFRARGKHVLLIVDSLTRLAMALREVGLAAGEPPAAKGYPPSVFSTLSAFIERGGNGAEGQGSITAVHTVLVEGDDHVADPVADTARAALDGHIILSRALAEAAIYPPIDIAASLSRPMKSLVSPTHMELASRFRALWTRRAEKQDIIDLGAYAPGRDTLLDEAIARAPAMEAMLRQDTHSAMSLEASLRALGTALA